MNPLPNQMTLISKIGTALATFGLCLASQAASINGAIRFTSGANGGIIFQDSAGNITTNLADAAGIQSWVFPEVDVGDGSFINVPNGQAVSFSQPWIFPSSTPLTPLWTIVGFGNFAFNLSSSTIVFRDSDFLQIEGTGTFTGTDTLTNTAYDATPATWTFSTQGSGPTDTRFSWNASTVAVPEPGTSALLSGILLWICFIRRRALS